MAAKRLDEVPVDDVADPMLASLLQAKQRELRLQVEMLAVSRLRPSFLALSIEQYGAVTADAPRRAPRPSSPRSATTPGAGPVARCRRRSCKAAQAELDRYRAFAPDIESHVEMRRAAPG